MTSLPTTQWNLVLTAAETGSPAGRRALDAICRRYWPAVYAYVRSTGRDAESARDLTQGFFARFIEKGDIKQADRTRGKFRTFLFTSARHFLTNEREREHALRRGGGRSVFSLDVENAEARFGQSLVDPQTPETIYERRWAVTLLEHALTRLETDMAGSKHAKDFPRFLRLLAPGGGESSYRDLARELGSTETSIKVTVHRMRRRFGALLRDEVAHTLHEPSAADVEDVIRRLFSAMGSRART